MKCPTPTNGKPSTGDECNFKTEPSAIATELVILDGVAFGNDPAVSARHLHSVLGISQDFTSWAKAQIKRAGLEDGIDFILLTQKGEQVGRHGGSNRVDYLFATDAAKHVALMSATSKGREIRKYLIEVEKDYRRRIEGAHLTLAEQLGRLELVRDQIEAAGSNAGRVLGSLRRSRKESDAALIPLRAQVQPSLFYGKESLHA